MKNQSINMSYKDVFKSDYKVLIEKKDGYSRYAMLGDIKEAYKLLRDEVNARNPRNMDEYIECVERVIIHYFGNYANIKNRMNIYPKGDDGGKVSNMAHKNMALGIERAMLAQNLLWEVGVDSVFKISDTIINDKIVSHGYNLIDQVNKQYILDVTIPTEKNGRVFPIVCEIPKEIYDQMIKNNDIDGYSVHVKHLNPLDCKEYDITYDAGKDNVYEGKKSFTKKKVLNG